MVVAIGLLKDFKIIDVNSFKDKVLLLQDSDEAIMGKTVMKEYEKMKVIYTESSSGKFLILLSTRLLNPELYALVFGIKDSLASMSQVNVSHEKSKKRKKIEEASREIVVTKAINFVFFERSWMELLIISRKPKYF